MGQRTEDVTQVPNSEVVGGAAAGANAETGEPGDERGQPTRESTGVEPEKSEWNDCRRQLFALADELAKSVPNVGKSEQKELSRLLALFPDVVALRNPACASVYELGIRSVLNEHPSKEMAKRIRERVARQVRKKTVVQRVFSPETAIGATIYGLGVLTYLALPIGLAAFTQTVSGTTLGLPRDAVAWAISMGAIGSVVSMMLKLDKLANTSHPNVPLLFWYAFFKPLIGAAFAFFVFAVIASGEFPLKFTLFNASENMTRTGLYIVIAVSFVAGFSERFAPDITMQVGTSSSNAKVT